LPTLPNLPRPAMTASDSGLYCRDSDVDHSFPSPNPVEEEDTPKNARGGKSELVKLDAPGAGKVKVGISGVYEPGRPTIDDDRVSRIPARMLNAELTCPICLSILRSTHTVMECMHRFCQMCIQKYLRLGQKECPKCRVKVSSRRALRPDPQFDALVTAFYPGLPRPLSCALPLRHGFVLAPFASSAVDAGAFPARRCTAKGTWRLTLAAVRR
jgi:hypothetical protein